MRNLRIKEIVLGVHDQTRQSQHFYSFPRNSIIPATPRIRLSGTRGLPEKNFCSGSYGTEWGL
jgi:hypothetical protein